MTPQEFTKARRRLGLSQAELARRLGLDRVTLWRYETGRLAIPRTVDLAMAAIAHERAS